LVIDAEVPKIIDKGHKRAKRLLSVHRTESDALAVELEGKIHRETQE
jgi:ATP-dependent Zn protease